MRLYGNSHSSMYLNAPAQWEQRSIPIKQPFLGKFSRIIAYSINHHLNHTVGVMMRFRQSFGREAQMPCDRRTNPIGIQQHSLYLSEFFNFVYL